MKVQQESSTPVWVLCSAPRRSTDRPTDRSRQPVVLGMGLGPKAIPSVSRESPPEPLPPLHHIFNRLPKWDLFPNLPENFPSPGTD